MESSMEKLEVKCEASRDSKLDQTTMKISTKRVFGRAQTDINDRKKYRHLYRLYGDEIETTLECGPASPKRENKAAEGEAENINTQNLRLNEIHIWFLRYLYVVIKLSKLWSENFHCYRFFSAVAALDSFLGRVCRRFRLCVGSFFFIWLREESARCRRILGENKSVYKMKMTSFYFLIFCSCSVLCSFTFYGYCLLLCLPCFSLLLLSVFEGVFRKIVIAEICNVLLFSVFNREISGCFDAMALMVWLLHNSVELSETLVVGWGKLEKFFISSIVSSLSLLPTPIFHRFRNRQPFFSATPPRRGWKRQFIILRKWDRARAGKQQHRWKKCASPKEDERKKLFRFGGNSLKFDFRVWVAGTHRVWNLEKKYNIYWLVIRKINNMPELYSREGKKVRKLFFSSRARKSRKKKIIIINYAERNGKIGWQL